MLLAIKTCYIKVKISRETSFPGKYILVLKLGLVIIISLKLNQSIEWIQNYKLCRKTEEFVYLAHWKLESLFLLQTKHNPPFNLNFISSTINTIVILKMTLLYKIYNVKCWLDSSLLIKVTAKNHKYIILHAQYKNKTQEVAKPLHLKNRN